MVARVHSPGQHLVQVHVCALVQQRTPRPAHAQGQLPLPSLLPSGAAAALGRRRRQRQAPGAGAAPLGPAVHPEPWRARPGGGGPRRGRSAALRRAPVTARGGPGEAPRRLKGRDPRPTARRRAAQSTHFFSARGGWPRPSPSGAGSTRSPSPPDLSLPGSGARHPHWPLPLTTRR